MCLELSKVAQDFESTVWLQIATPTRQSAHTSSPLLPIPPSKSLQHPILSGSPTPPPLRSMVTALSHTTIVPAFCMNKNWKIAHGQPPLGPATEARAPRHQSNALTPRHKSAVGSLLSLVQRFQRPGGSSCPKRTARAAPLRGADLMAQRVLRVLRRLPRMVWRRKPSLSRP